MDIIGDVGTAKFEYFLRHTLNSMSNDSYFQREDERRFSLYLSGALALGITRITYEQIKKLLRKFPHMFLRFKTYIQLC